MLVDYNISEWCNWVENVPWLQIFFQYTKNWLITSQFFCKKVWVQNFWHQSSKVVGPTGLEPVTNRLWADRSNQLSYRPFLYTWTKNYISFLTETQVLRNFLPSNLITFFFENTTVPSLTAWTVKSLHWITLSPITYLSPFCLMRILPETTLCPPNFFTPRNLGLLSLRFLDDQPAFLWAMSKK